MSQSNLKMRLKTIDLAEYEEVVYKNRELLSDWAYAMQDAQEEGTRAASMEEAECFEALKQNLLPSATQLASELNITKEDLESMTGVGIHDNEEFENARWVDAFRNNYRLLNNR